MDGKKYTAKTAAALNADGIKRLYKILEAEETPFEARVRNVGGERLVTIATEPTNEKHFTDILNLCKGGGV